MHENPRLAAPVVQGQEHVSRETARTRRNAAGEGRRFGPERNTVICAQRAAGFTLAEIGSRYGLTREAVRKITRGVTVCEEARSARVRAHLVAALGRPEVKARMVAAQNRPEVQARRRAALRAAWARSRREPSHSEVPRACSTSGRVACGSAASGY